MSNPAERLHGRWRGYLEIAPSAYRFLTFGLSTIQVIYSPTGLDTAIPAVFLIAAVGLYTLIKVLYPLRWNTGHTLGHVIFGLDVAICLSLVITTGGLSSPFLPYSLTPVLTVSLIADKKTAFITTGVIIGGVYLSPVTIPPHPSSVTGPFFLFILAACLTATLPYLVNVNFRQSIRTEDILSERYRLSREVHDEIGQTVAALRWRAEVVQSRLQEMGIDLPDAGEMVKLSVKAYQDTRECLSLLRSYNGHGRLVPYLKEHVESLKQRSDVSYTFSTEAGGFNLERPVELQLLRICQEALLNVTKHAGARHVHIKVQPVDGHLAVSIADDGQGFDAVAYYQNLTSGESQGLAVMRERAESIGGRLRILSLPGRGTEVQVEVPFVPNEGKLWAKP